MRRECNTLKYRKNEREIYKNSNKHKQTSYSSSSYQISREEFGSSKDQRKGEGKHNTKGYVLLKYILHHLNFFQRIFKQGKGERKCNANWYVNMGVFCIFILYKEILANLHPSTEQQAESNIPDLVQTISQSMEYMMVDIDEDPEESFFQDIPPHLTLQPTDSAPNFVLGSSSTSQIRVNSSKQHHKKTCAAC